LTNYSRYILDFISNHDSQKKEVFKYFLDTLYIRYPTILINSIKHNNGKAWSDIIEIVQDLMTIIRGVLDKIKKGSHLSVYRNDLKDIASKWEKLRDNFQLEENFEDVEKDVVGDKNFHSIFESIYAVLFDENESLVSDLIDSYLYRGVSRLSSGIDGVYGSTQMYYRPDEIRHFIKSNNEGTSQYVYQIPLPLIENKIIRFNSKTKKIFVNNTQLNLLKSDNIFYYRYICILTAAIQKDWNIVKLVSENFLKKFGRSHEDENIIEEVKFLRNLSLRYDLSYQLALHGFTDSLYFRFFSAINSIDELLNQAIDKNNGNPRVMLSRFSFQIEKYVYAKKYEATYNKINDELNSSEIYDVLIQEFNQSQKLKIIEDNFNGHTFKDYLFLMYYKCLLTFYLYCINSNNSNTNKGHHFDNKKAQDHLDQLKLYHSRINQENRYFGTKFIIEAVDQFLLNKPYSLQKLETPCKNLPKHSFLRRFVSRPIKDMVEELESGNYQNQDFGSII